MTARLVETLQNALVTALVGLPDPIPGLLAGSAVEVDGRRLDPQIQLLLRLMAMAGMPALESLSPADARAVFRSTGGALAGSPIQMADVKEAVAVHGDVRVPLRIYVPRSGRQPHPVLVYYHGGGWTIGDLDTHDNVARRFADRGECMVISVDYRLGPEHPFPAAVDDAIAAFAWAVSNAQDLGGDPGRIAVGGDSAGGNLAAVVAQQTCRRGLRQPDLQLLVYPVTDLAAETRSYESFASGFYLTRAGMRWFRDNYLGGSGDALDPRASPLRAESVRGVAPTVVLTAGFDVLRDEGRAYAERLDAEGVEVEYREYPSLIHGFISMAGVVRGAAEAFDDAAGAVGRAFSRAA